jgi:general L-amino acid transport system substrate-binding protein
VLGIFARVKAALYLFVPVFVLAAGTSPTSAITLETVRERGFLVCASASPLPGFAQQSETGLWSGFDVDLCRAISAAVLGDPDLVEFRPLSGESRFALLQTGDVDIIIRNASWTMSRDTHFGAHYVTPMFFDGQAFLAPHRMGVVSAFELDNVSVCVVDAGEARQKLSEFFFSTQAAYTEVVYESREDLLVAYRSGLCDVISASASWLYAIRRDLADPTGHRILPERISNEAFGPVVREGDDRWFNTVRWVMFALIEAEELGVTSLNTEQMLAVRTPSIRRLLGVESDFGASLGLSADWARNAIRAVGNYGEIFQRNFGPQTGSALLRGQNSLWTKGGLIVSPPIR